MLQRLAEGQFWLETALLQASRRCLKAGWQAGETNFERVDDVQRVSVHPEETMMSINYLTYAIHSSCRRDHRALYALNVQPTGLPCLVL